MFAHTLGCLQNWQPMVGNIGTIGAIDFTNSINGRTLDGIGTLLTVLFVSSSYISSFCIGLLSNTACETNLLFLNAVKDVVLLRLLHYILILPI